MHNNNEDIFKGIPYDERRCSRCGKHIDELEPYGSDAGINEGQPLVKIYRKLDMAHYSDECEMILHHIAKFGDTPELHELYGTDKIQSAIRYEGMRDWCERSWECKDCIKEEGPLKPYIDNKD